MTNKCLIVIFLVEYNAATHPGPLVVDLDAVTEADLTFVQLIEALRRSATDAGRAVSLAHPAGEAVRDVLQRGGFLDDDTSERALFWLQGAKQ